MPNPTPPRQDIFGPGGHVTSSQLSDSATRVLKESLRFAGETRWDMVRSPHIFMGLLAVSDPGVQAWGRRLGADLPKLLDDFQELFHQEDGDKAALLRLNREFLSDNVIRLLRDANARAIENGRSNVSSMDLLITLLTTSNSIVAECFERIGVTAAKLTELAVIAEQQARD